VVGRDDRIRFGSQQRIDEPVRNNHDISERLNRALLASLSRGGFAEPLPFCGKRVIVSGSLAGNVPSNSLSS
jgi:hypothetical protein